MPTIQSNTSVQIHKDYTSTTFDMDVAAQSKESSHLIVNVDDLNDQLNPYKHLTTSVVKNPHPRISTPAIIGTFIGVTTALSVAGYALSHNNQKDASSSNIVQRKAMGNRGYLETLYDPRRPMPFPDYRTRADSEASTTTHSTTTSSEKVNKIKFDSFDACKTAMLERRAQNKNAGVNFNECYQYGPPKGNQYKQSHR